MTEGQEKTLLSRAPRVFSYRRPARTFKYNYELSKSKPYELSHLSKSRPHIIKKLSISQSSDVKDAKFQTIQADIVSSQLNF